jgi:hypothetical protein
LDFKEDSQQFEGFVPARLKRVRYGGVMVRSSWLRIVVFAVVLLVLLLPAVHAQVPTSTINGIVTDPKDAVVAGARVVVTETATGVVRETKSNSDGHYVISDLPDGSYDLRIEAPGFAVNEVKGVVTEAGRATTLDARLQIAVVGTSVTVTEAPGNVELTQSMIQGQIDSSTIRNIPLNGRNFLELAYLIPGNRPAPTFDPTKTNTLEVSSAGGFGRGGNITVDGGDNNDEVVGGTLSNFPADSIQEFQIATGRFTSEVGRSGNSIINIVTKGGSNQYHGSIFDYERNRHLQGLPATFDRALPAPAFDRQQFGGSMGGPIIQDKAWWFASAEYRDQNAALQTGTRDFATDEILNTSSPAPLRDALVSSRFDYQLSTRNAFMARYSFNRSTDIGPASPAQAEPAFSAAERQNSLNRFNSLVAGVTTTVSSTQVNSLSFHFDQFFNNIPTFPNNAPTTDPPLGLTNELLFPDLADGENFNLPQATHLNRYQVRDSYSWSIGKHQLRIGGEFQQYNAHGLINPFGTGSVILTSDFGFQDLNGDGVVNDLDIPIAVSIKSQAPVTPVPIPNVGDSYVAGYVQDDWRVTPKLTLNLGLRYDYDSDLTGTDSNSGPCSSLTQEPTHPCVWVANVINLKHSPDKKDLGPRFGFAYDPFGHGKTVIRGGYGIYYDRIILEVMGEQRVQDDRQLAVQQYAGSSCTFPGGPPTPSLNYCFAPGATFAPGSPTLADPFAGPSEVGGVGIIAVSNDTHHPIFQQFSLGAQQQLGSSWLLSADGLHVFGEKQIIGHYLRSTDSNSPYVSCPGDNIPCTVTDPLTGISDNVTLLESAAKSWYDGLIVSVQHRPVTLGKVTYLYNLSYTLSKTLDYSDDDQLTNNNVDEQVDLAEGLNSLRLEKGYAATDERHRLTAYGLLQMPWGLSLAPIYTFGSGVPADTYLPGITSRLPLLSRNDLGRGIKNSNQLNAVINEWNALPPCPAPAPCNAGGPIQNVPANVSFFSPFSSLDMRLTKDFHFGEHMQLSLIGEGFNIFNNTNIRGSTNANFSGRDISILSGTGTQPSFYSGVSTAGGFFGSGGPRAFQFAVRFAV